MKILVTGGAGYLGSVLVPMLLDSGHSVHILDAFRHGGQSLAACCANPCFEATRGDARDVRALDPLVRWADVVLPLAAIVGAPACDADQVGSMTTNLLAIHDLIGLTSRDQMVIFPNTNSGYGTGGAEPLTEDAPLNPVSRYGLQKAEAEGLVLERDGVSLRFATLFGASPRMRVDLLVNDFVHRAATDGALVLYEGSARRNYLHVRDAARAFAHAIERFNGMRGRTFNVGLDDANLSKRELCDRIKAHIPNFTWFEAPVGEDPDRRDYLVSNARIAATGFQPTRSLADGIAELVTLYRMLRVRGYGNA